MAFLFQLSNISLFILFYFIFYFFFFFAFFLFLLLCVCVCLCLCVRLPLLWLFLLIVAPACSRVRYRRPLFRPSVRLSTFMSTFDIYVKVSILINYKTKQPSNLA